MEQEEHGGAICEATTLARIAWCIARIAKEVSATTLEHAESLELPDIKWTDIGAVNHVSQKWLELGEHYAPQVLNMLRNGVA